MTRVLINGRFLGQRTTGVQRFAGELLRAMDGLYGAPERTRSGLQLEVLAPPGTTDSLGLQAIPVTRVGRFQGHLWEQVDLPRHAGSNLLINLGNTAPLAARHTITTILDASIYAVPEAYSLAFRAWYRLLLPTIGWRASRVVTCSEFSRMELQHYAGIARSRTTVIYGSGKHILELPADPAVVERLALRPQGYVLAVSSRSRHKNLAGVERAASLLAAGDLSVVLAGGSNSRVFKGSSSSSGKRLERTGYVTDAELRALYENAACLVYPSFYEGFGLPPLEAMSCGCPVVVSRAASLPEVCADAAIYCDPNDPGDIARQIEPITTDASLRADLSRRGLQRADQFSWKQSAGSLLELVAEQAGP